MIQTKLISSLKWKIYILLQMQECKINESEKNVKQQVTKRRWKCFNQTHNIYSLRMNKWWIISHINPCFTGRRRKSKFEQKIPQICVKKTNSVKPFDSPSDLVLNWTILITIWLSENSYHSSLGQVQKLYTQSSCK